MLNGDADAPPSADPLNQLADRLQRLLKNAADKPKPRTVHHLRTTIRRFETVLPAAGDVRGEAKLRKQVDRIRKRAGKLRDVDVHLRLLATLGAASADYERERVQAALEKSRAKRRKRLAETLADECDRGIAKRIRQVAARAVGRRTGAAPEILGVVLERFGRLLEAASPVREESLHEFRIDSKRLRYLAETAPASAETTLVATHLKRVQDAIGAWHDWLTLAERAAEVLEPKEGAVSALLDELQSRTREKLARALSVTASAGGRLAALRRLGPRKAARPVRSEPELASKGARASA